MSNATYYAVLGERARRDKKSNPFYVTFVVQNHQLNHLPPTDLKNRYHLASSELSLHFTEKTSAVTLTVFLIILFERPRGPTIRALKPVYLIQYNIKVNCNNIITFLSILAQIT